MDTITFRINESKAHLDINRTHWAVGAGFFSTQQIRTRENKYINIVYDCGTNNSINLVVREVDKYVKYFTDEVDYIFISHLDKDHVNGLEYLVSKLKNKPKKIFYPAVSNSEILILSAKYHAIPSSQQPNVEILANLQEYFSSLAEQAVPVSPESNDYHEIIELDEPQLDNDIEPVSSDSAPSPKVSSSYPDPIIDIWTLSFECSLKLSSQQNKFLNSLASELGYTRLIFDKKMLDEAFKQNIILKRKKELIKAYKSVGGMKNLNNTSLFLYSGIPPQNRRKFKVFRSLFKSCSWWNNIAAGCWTPEPGWIGTGDAPLQTQYLLNQFNNNFKDYKKISSIITIPHHASKHNWNNGIMNDLPSYSVYVAGANGLYNHPDSGVLKKIIMNGGIPVIVNDNEKNIFSSSVYIHIK